MDKLVVKKTQIEMLLDRGYEELPNELALLNDDAITRKKYKKLNYNAVYTKDDKTLYVHYLNIKKPIKSLEACVHEGLNHDKVILIGYNEEKKNKTFTNILDNLSLIPLETFTYEDLMYNVTKHIGVPKHEKIKQFLPASKDELPIILMSDPVAKYYGWENGDIIKITRHYDLNLLSPKEYGYRIVRNHLL
jgi:DNA-directed RNA polymerase I, II, and III subunit RPABC1